MNWVAIYCRFHASDFEEFDTREEAERFLTVGADNGDLYQVGILDRSTGTIHDLDPLDATDFTKVREWCIKEGLIKA